MARIEDIANKLNISKGTVSKALNGAPDVSETLRKAVLETAVCMTSGPLWEAMAVKSISLRFCHGMLCTFT